MGAVVRVDGRPRKAVGKLGRHGLAEHDAACGAHQSDAGGVGDGPVAAIDRRAVLGRQLVRVDHVLDADRRAFEAPRPAGAVDRARLGKRALGVEEGPGLDRRTRFDAFETGAHERFRRQAALGERGDRLRER